MAVHIEKIITQDSPNWEGRFDRSVFGEFVGMYLFPLLKSHRIYKGISLCRPYSDKELQDYLSAKYKIKAKPNSMSR